MGKYVEVNNVFYDVFFPSQVPLRKLVHRVLWLIILLIIIILILIVIPILLLLLLLIVIIMLCSLSVLQFLSVFVFCPSLHFICK